MLESSWSNWAFNSSSRASRVINSRSRKSMALEDIYVSEVGVLMSPCPSHTMSGNMWPSVSQSRSWPYRLFLSKPRDGKYNYRRHLCNASADNSNRNCKRQRTLLKHMHPGQSWYNNHSKPNLRRFHQSGLSCDGN